MRVVPDWDEYWMGAAWNAATRSKDPSTQVGAILVAPGHQDSIMTGYNGFVPGAPDVAEHWDNRDEKYPRVIHAELNAICRAARRGRATEGATLYVTHFPCLECAKAIAAAGIKRLVYADRIDRPGKDFAYEHSTARLTEAGIEIVKFPTEK